jgi:hypothetical protein
VQAEEGEWLVGAEHSAGKSVVPVAPVRHRGRLTVIAMGCPEGRCRVVGLPEGAAGGRQQEADLGKHGAPGRRRRHVAEAASGVPKDRERREEVGAGEVAIEGWRSGAPLSKTPSGGGAGRAREEGGLRPGVGKMKGG